MPSLRVQNFGGIAPRISDRLLPTELATVAENCDLSSGEIRAYNNLRLDSDISLSGGEVQTIYNLDGYWLSWSSDVDVVRGFVPGDLTGRIYYSGDGPPKSTDRILATTAAPYPSGSYPLALQPPQNNPTLLFGSNPGSGSPKVRFYIYTFVTGYGEESAPSPVSGGVEALDGQSIVLGEMAISSHPNALSKRIYRTSTGTTSTEYLFVAEIPNTTITFTDEILEVNLGERLVSEDWLPPPDNLSGLVAHPNGFITGFVGNQLYVSEAYQPHAYPAEYVKVLDYPIVAVGVFGNTFVVTTTGYTYLVTGITPRNLTVERLPDPYPNVSKRSLVSGDRGVIYGSNDGLIWVGYGGLQVVTRDVLTRKEWSRWNPNTLHGVAYDGKYVGFYRDSQVVPSPFNRVEGAGFMFDYGDRATGISARDRLTTLNFYASASFASPTVNLHFVVPNPNSTLAEWNAGSGLLGFKWRSKAFVMPYLTTFAAAKVVNDFKGPVNFRLVVGNRERYSRTVVSSEPFRLPRFYREVESWFVEVSGVSDIQEIHLSTSMQELAEGDGQ